MAVPGAHRVDFTFAPEVLEESPETTTSAVAPVRKSVVRDGVEASAPPPLPLSVASDALLAPRPRPLEAITVLGLGALPEDPRGLGRRLAKVYAAQGGPGAPHHRRGRRGCARCAGSIAEA